MKKVYLKYPDINDVNSKGWSTASPMHLIAKYVKSHLVNSENDADIIIYNKHPITRDEIMNIKFPSKNVL